MKSNMVHQFANVPSADIPRSSFNRDHGYKTTFDADYIYPIYCDEALPGDTFNLKMTAFARMATPIYPVMDNLFMDTFFFEVPVRLLWSNWKKLHGEQVNPGDSIDYTVPVTVAPAVTGHLEGSLSDYLGIPTQIADLSHSSLFHRAYNIIYNEWFRDQNLVNAVPGYTGDGPDPITAFTLQKRGKRHDYFTSCLPWPQKGDSIDLPLGTVAPVYGIGKGNQVYSDGPATVYETEGTASTSYTSAALISTGGTQNYHYVEEDPNNTGYPGIYADLTNATAATINQLRQSFQIQKLVERDARGGTRYTEIIRAHFGVRSPDARLQRPSYLGGGTTQININPVAQTSSTDVTSPQGNLAATATAMLNNHGFTQSFTEHSIIMGLVNVRADLTYQEGLDRQFSRSTRYDFYYPALAQIGEQAVLNKEIYADGSANDDLVFGYQERYGEYRYKQSKITGAFRSNAATPLDAWHLSQEFGGLPTLNSTFINSTTPMDRVVAVTSEPDFIFDSFFQLRCARPMPLYGVPGLIDHF